MKIGKIAVAMGSALMGLAPACHAGLISLTPASVIGGSGSWNNNVYNVGNYRAGNVFDNQLATSIPEGNHLTGDADGGFWLGREGRQQEYFVVDLGASYAINFIKLFNTHNGTAQDRWTTGFTFYASNQIQSVAGAGFDLLNGVSIGNGTLGYQSLANDPIDAQVFQAAQPVTARYLRFNVTSGGTLGVGLNEMQVFSVPEPAGWALTLTALALVGARRRASSSRA